MKKGELRCEGGHLHGIAFDYLLERYCPQCSKKAGVKIVHLWDSRTWPWTLVEGAEHLN